MIWLEGLGCNIFIWDVMIWSWCENYIHKYVFIRCVVCGEIKIFSTNFICWVSMWYFLFDINVYQLSFIRGINIKLNDPLLFLITRYWLSGNRISWCMYLSFLLSFYMCFWFDINVYQISFIWKHNPELEDMLLAFILGCWLFGDRINGYIFMLVLHDFCLI